jgi:hypothetical protein
MLELLLAFAAGSLCGWAASRARHSRELRRMARCYEPFLPGYLRPLTPHDVSIKDDWLHIEPEARARNPRGRFCVHLSDGTILTFGQPHHQTRPPHSAR